MPAMTNDGKQIVTVWPTEGKRRVFFSPNWCDPTTWYEESVYVEDEIAIEVTPATFQLAHSNVIDTAHGKLSDEDFLRDSAGRSYLVEVRVDGVLQVERDPDDTSGGDYLLNYATGTITFFVAPVKAPVVRYHYEDGSAWTLRAPEDKIFWVKSSEVQFTADVDISDTVTFQAYGSVDYFAPQLVAAGVIPSGTKIPLGNPATFKTIQDFVNEANGAYPVIPAIGGSSWRGMPQAVHTFPWAYQAMIEVNGARLMEIVIRLVHDRPYGGHSATATFYCLETDA